MKLHRILAGVISASFCIALSATASAQVDSLSLSAAPQEHDHVHSPFSGSDAHDFIQRPPPMEANLGQGWLDPWPHTHYSRRGTPFVHLFANEPAFIDRDLFLDFAFTSADDGREIEAAFELEYGFTRRIGLVIEAPYAYLDPDGAPSESGLGDVAVSPRVLLLEYDCFYLSANFEFAFPTGDEDRGLGAGQASFAPSISTWIDLGNRFTLHNNVGIEHGLRDDSDVLAWGGAITHSIYLKGEPQIIRDDGAVRAHFPQGLLNLIVEIRGELPLDGPDRGSGTATWFLGASYALTPHLDVRGALTFPAWTPREFNNGAIFGLVYHF